jgi:hypothetical protein
MTAEIAKALAVPGTVSVIGIFFLLIFRKNISSLIDRIRNAQGGGVGVNFDPLEALTQRTEQALVRPSPSTSPAMVGTDDVLREFESPMVIEIEDNVFKELEKRKLLNGERSGAVRILARSLAKLIHTNQLDTTYNSAFGSQIGLLAYINGQATGVPEKEVREYYQRKQQEHPGLKDYSYEDYMKFMTETVLLTKDGGNYKATVRGREFLQHIAATGKSFNKNF